MENFIFCAVLWVFQHSSFYVVSLIVREIKSKVVVFYETKLSQRKTLNVGKRKEKDKQKTKENNKIKKQIK